MGPDKQIFTHCVLVLATDPFGQLAFFPLTTTSFARLWEIWGLLTMQRAQESEKWPLIHGCQALAQLMPPTVQASCRIQPFSLGVTVVLHNRIPLLQNPLKIIQGPPCASDLQSWV